MYFEIFPKNTLRFKNIWNAGHYHFRKSGSHYFFCGKDKSEQSRASSEYDRDYGTGCSGDSSQTFGTSLRNETFRMSPVWATTKLFARNTAYSPPIASRLGVYAMKAPLEDLSFFYLSPKEHSILSEQMFRHEHYRDRIIRSASEKIQELLHRQGIESEAVGRIKHLYSVSQKMKRKHTDSINEIYDILRFAFLFQCFRMLRHSQVIHEHFIPLPNLLKITLLFPNQMATEVCIPRLWGFLMSLAKPFR